MVFLFGFDVPIVEVVVVLNIITLATLIMLIVTLHRTKQMNRKLDRILGEEKQFRKELDITKEEEDAQLKIIRHIVKDLHTLTEISEGKHEGMAAVKRLAAKASKKVRGARASAEFKQVVRELAAQVIALDKVTAQEDKQLQQIRKILSRLKTK